MSASTRRRTVSDPDVQRRGLVAVAVAPPLMALTWDADAERLDGYGVARTSGVETVRRREGMVADRRDVDREPKEATAVGDVEQTTSTTGTTRKGRMEKGESARCREIIRRWTGCEVTRIEGGDRR